MSKAQRLAQLAEKYSKATNKLEFTAREVAKWAISKGWWKPSPFLVEQRCAEEISAALRDEVAKDPQGRLIRVKHAFVDPKHPEQGTLWVDIRTATPQQMELAFEMRRQQIIGDCKQLKRDVDSYNQNNNPGKPIQMSFNFEDEIIYGKLRKTAPENSPFKNRARSR